MRYQLKIKSATAKKRTKEERRKRGERKRGIDRGKNGGKEGERGHGHIIAPLRQRMRVARVCAHLEAKRIMAMLVAPSWDEEPSGGTTSVNDLRNRLR